MGSFDSNDKFDYSGALARALEAGIPVTLFYGKTDTACDYVGGRRMAETLSWGGMASFAALPDSPLLIAGIEVGQQKTYKGLTYVAVESAGHMVHFIKYFLHFSSYYSLKINLLLISISGAHGSTRGCLLCSGYHSFNSLGE